MVFATEINLQLGFEYVLLLPIWLITIGWLAGRILGIHLGRWRAALAAFWGWNFGIVAAALVFNEPKPSPFDLIPLTIFFGVLLTLPLAIVVDVITRPAGPPRRRRRRPIKAIRGAFAPLGRFREIVGNARRENLVSARYRSAAALDSADFARRLRKVLEDSGGMFVKFGQIASTRSDLLPRTVTDELSHLQSDVRPVPEPEVVEVLERELGESVDTAFESFSAEPLAAASIGQTHRAVLKGGERVVVKVQPPGNRRPRLPRLGRARAGGPATRSARGGGPPRRRKGSRRRADHRHRGRARLLRRGRGGDAAEGQPGRRRRHRRTRRARDPLHRARAGDGRGGREAGVGRGGGRRGRGLPPGAGPPPAHLDARPDPGRRALPRRPAPRQRDGQPRRHAVAARLRSRGPARSARPRRAAGHRARLHPARSLAACPRRAHAHRRRRERPAPARARPRAPPR